MAAAALVLSPTTIDPAPYHRIISPSLRVPEDKSVPVPVGLLACQRNPLLIELETYVITFRASQGLQASKDKKKKEDSKPQGPIYEILLHDTIIFPEGGGQPSDIGYIEDRNGVRWEVLEAKRHGGHAIHYVKGDEANLEALTPGAAVTVRLGDAGFKRRYDHMCMHTSQHLISALLETKLDLPTPSWYLAPSPNPSYIEVPRTPTAEQLKEIEDAANNICWRGTRVHIEVEELKNESQREASEDRNASKGLPADYTGGVNRTVVIENVDRNPCCGTHLPTLQGVSIFILPETESLSRGRARIYFCAGPRIQAYLAQTHGYLAAAASSYGCAPNQVAERIMFEADGRKKANKRAEELESEVAGFIVKELRDALENQADESRFTKYYQRQDSSSNPLALLNMVEQSWSSMAISKPYLIVLVSTGTQTSSKNAVILIFGSDEKEVKEIGDKLKAKGIKGGGKGKWSGKTDNWKKEIGTMIVAGMI